MYAGGIESIDFTSDGQVGVLLSKVDQDGVVGGERLAFQREDPIGAKASIRFGASPSSIVLLLFLLTSRKQLSLGREKQVNVRTRNGTPFTRQMLALTVAHQLKRLMVSHYPYNRMNTADSQEGCCIGMRRAHGHAMDA